MKLYHAVFCANKAKEIEAGSYVDLANNEAEMIGLTLQRCLRELPKQDGWQNQRVIVVEEIPFYLIEQAYIEQRR